MPVTYKVSIAKSSDAARALREAIDLLGGMKAFVKSGQEVLLKPNCLISKYVPGTTTSAQVIAGLAQMVLQAGGRPVIGEFGLNCDSSAKDFETSCARHYRDELTALGIQDQVRMVDFAKDQADAVTIPGAKVLAETKVVSTALKADVIIDVPVMKTHDQTQVTLGIKNLKGCIPQGEKRRSHGLGVEQAIVDLCGFLRPRLVVIDGMTAAEGMGPAGGTPFAMNTIVASGNPLAADMVGAKIMGFELEDIHFIQNAIASGLGPTKFEQIEIVGEPLAEVRRPFVTAQSVVLKQYQEMGIRVISRNVCSGCWAEFRHIYYSLRDQRAKLAGITFVLGQVEDLPPDIEPGKLVILGRCAKRLKARGAYVPGCPPHHSDIEKALCPLADIDPAKIDSYMK